MKPCVMVTQEMGSEGGSVAVEACQLTGYRLVLNQSLGKAARNHGMRGAEWRWLEQGWDRQFACLDDRPDAHLTALRSIVLELCAGGRGALFLGRGIRELLLGHAPLVSVHVVAPFQTRVERIMRQVNLLRPRAEERVRHSDGENAWFYRYFFDVDWADRRRYDLVLDTATMHPKDAAQRIARAVGHALEPGSPSVRVERHA